MTSRTAIVTALLLGLLPLRAVAQDGPPLASNPFTPAIRADQGEQTLRTLQAAVEQQDWPTVATALHEWSATHDGQLVSRGDGHWLSPASWLAHLSVEQLAAVRAAYRQRFDAPAIAAFDAARADPSLGPDTFAELTARYPLSTIPGAAFAEAADRSFHLGDAWAAAACFTFAQQAGTRLDANRTANLEASLRFTAPPPPKRFSGQVPVQSVWYGQLESVGLPRYFPLVADGTLYLAAARNMIALGEQGNIAWNWGFEEKKPRPLERAKERGRGPIFKAAVLGGADGVKIVVARQRKDESGDYVLRAFRASDGRLLWSTQQHRTLEKLCFAGTPAVIGRYVYCMAKDYAQDPPGITLAALNIMDGAALWQTTLGTLANPTHRTIRNRRDEDDDGAWGWDDFFEQNEPAVAGDAVYVCPNVGHIMALGRFDGKVRWLRAYDKRRGIGFGDGEGAAGPLLPPGTVAEYLRWSNTPVVAGTILLAAPHDTNSVFAHSAASGELLWKSDSLGGETLVGAHGSTAIFAGRHLAAVDASTGKIKWQIKGTHEQRLVGPAALFNGILYAPTNRGLLTFAAEDGKPATNAPKPLDVAALAKSETLLQVLQRAELASAFDMPDPDTLKVGDRVLKLPAGPAPDHVVDAFAEFAPGWRLANCGPDGNPGPRDEFAGRGPVFVTHPLDPNTPCSISRIMRLPKDRRLALKMRVTHNPNADWRLVAKVNGKEIINQTIDKKATGGTWLKLYVELAEYAGKDVMIELYHYPTGWTNESAYWVPFALENR